jgi:hypothetical protein
LATYADIHVDDIGTEFLATMVEYISGVETPVDIADSIRKEITFRKPDGTVLIKTAVYTPATSGGTGTGSDGKISYFSSTGDLDLPGTYRVQGIVANPSGKWSSSIDKFKVERNL